MWCVGVPGGRNWKTRFSAVTLTFLVTLDKRHIIEIKSRIIQETGKESFLNFEMSVSKFETSENVMLK